MRGRPYGYSSAANLFIVQYPFTGNSCILLGLSSGAYVERQCFSHFSEALQESQRRCAVDRAILGPRENLKFSPKRSPHLHRPETLRL